MKVTVRTHVASAAPASPITAPLWRTTSAGIRRADRDRLSGRNRCAAAVPGHRHIGGLGVADREPVLGDRALVSTELQMGVTSNDRIAVGLDHDVVLGYAVDSHGDGVRTVSKVIDQHRLRLAWGEDVVGAVDRECDLDVVALVRSAPTRCRRSWTHFWT